MKFIVAQLGARLHYAVPRILWQRRSLARFYTDIAAIGALRRSADFSRSIRLSGMRRLGGRIPAGMPDALIRHFPLFGLSYRLKKWRARSEKDRIAAWLWAGREFGRRVVRSGFADADAVYVFSSAGQEILQRARELGLHGVLEQPSAPRRVYDRFYREESDAWPGWEHSPFDESSPEFIAREETEWGAADEVVCPSEFVAENLRRSAGRPLRCSVVPYGTDRPAGATRVRRTGDGLNVLFCGRVSLMKGLPWLQAALRRLGSMKIRCRLAGENFASPAVLADLKSQAEVLGIVPRTELRRLYEWADVFVLPTLCEGSATVCYEALGHGLPVITTPNSGSVVRDGVDGFIVPVRDSDAIAAKLETLAADSALLEFLSANARERSADFTLERYADRLSGVLRLGSGDPLLMPGITHGTDALLSR